MNTLDFKQFFEQSPGLVVVIDTDFTVVAVSDGFLQVTKTKRENIIGRDIFHAFPNNPGDISANGETLVRDSFIRVLTTRMADSLPVVKYDIPKPASEGGGFDVKYWQATNSPILDENNNVKYIIQRAEDVTENKTLIQQIDKQKIIGEAYKVGNDYVRNIFMQAPALVCMFRGPEHVYELANEKYLKLVSNKDIIGKPIREAFPELKGQGFFELLDEVYKTGKSFVGHEMPANFYPGSAKQEDIYVDFVYQATYDNKGKIDGILVHGINVTEQVLSRKKIEDSEKRYNMMLMKSPFAFAILKGKNKVIALANDQVKKIWGKGMDIEGKSLLDIMPELKDTPFPTILDEVYATGIPFHGVDIQSPKDPMGELKDEYFNFVFQPYLEADETISGITIIGYEVTAAVMVKKALEAQHEAEQKALKQIADSEKRYNMMLMKSPFGFAILKGNKMVITLANDSIKTFWGKGKDLEGKPLFDVISELKDSEFPGLLDKVYTTGIPFYGDELLATILRNGKQEEVYFNFVYQPYLEADETISGVTVIAYEVTAQVIVKKALEAQREAEQKALAQVEETNKRYYEMLMESPFAFSIMKGKDMAITLANDLMKKFWGKGNEVEGKTLLQLLPELKDQPFPEMIDHVFTTGKPVYANEILAQIKQNHKLEDNYFNIVYQPHYEADNTISGVTTIAYDVTEMLLARKKIEQSEQYFRQLTDLMPAKISNADPAGNVLYFNKHWLDYSGYSFEDLRDFGYHKIIHPDELDEFQKRFQKAGENGTVLEMEMRFMNKEGDYRWHLNLASPIKDENGQIKMWVGSTTEIHEQKSVSEKIKASEERFRLLVMQAPVSICVLRGEEYIIETINEGMLEMWDRKLAAAINRPAFDVLPEFRNQGLKELLDTVYSTGKRFVAQELPLTINRNGRYEDIFVKFVYEPLTEADGTITGVMALAHEITDQVNSRKTLEISEKKFRLLTNAMPQKISNADADGNVIFFNQQWLDDTGLTFEELKDWGWRKALHPDEIENIVENWKYSVSTGNIFDIEMRIKNKAGEYRWNLSRAVPIRDEAGKILMWVGSNTDIHEQKEQEAVLEKAVKSRTKELEIMNVELEKANKDLTSFTYVSSHDLQEPLRKIQNFVTLLLLEEEKNLSETGKGYFLKMTQTAKRMQALIEDLLTYSRAKNGERIIETVDLNLLLSEVRIDFEEVIQQKKAIIEADLCEARVIPFQFRQLIQNLISNSLKFSNPNLPPHIIMKSQIATGEELRKSCQPESHGKLTGEKKYCHIIFTDNGIGFEPQYKERIFEVFQRLHSFEEYAGTGIGLAICRRIIENHNGIITATGKLNEGAQFEIYIPA